MEEDNTKRESFEWIEGKPKVPIGMKGGYLKIVAKTSNPTHHANEPTRIFLPEELRENSRSLVGRVLTFDHKQEIVNSIILDSQYNEAEEQLECMAFVPEYIIEKVKDKVIMNASIDFTWRSVESKPEGMIFRGLGVFGLSLLDIKPGDSGATITLFEDSTSSGRLSAIAEIKTESSEPVKEAPKEKTPKVEPPKEEPKKEEPDPKDIRIKALEEAYTKVTKVNEDLKKEVESRVNEARKEGQRIVVKEIEGVIPPTFVENHFNFGAKRMSEELKKVLRKRKESLGDL
jgi:hypothetical protein